VPLTTAERKEQKAIYDATYRLRDIAARKAKKAAYYQRTHDPAKEAAARKLKMPKHIEYCRQPKYKAWKSEYDKKHLAKKAFGEFAEAALILRDVENEIAARATKYEIYQTNGTLNKAQTRRRAL
jgi:hypothetical protein